MIRTLIVEVSGFLVVLVVIAIPFWWQQRLLKAERLHRKRMLDEMIKSIDATNKKSKP